jgi:hypothetical protein
VGTVIGGSRMYRDPLPSGGSDFTQIFEVRRVFV